jgi:predicted branched-subunit amino acid permease
VEDVHIKNSMLANFYLTVNIGSYLMWYDNGCLLYNTFGNVHVIENNDKIMIYIMVSLVIPNTQKDDSRLVVGILYNSIL